MKHSTLSPVRAALAAGAALILACGLLLASGCMYDPGSGNRRVTVDNPLKPVECPKGFQWDDKTKNCVEKPPTPAE